jgi:hypothetical protein
VPDSFDPERRAREAQAIRARRLEGARPAPLRKLPFIVVGVVLIGSLLAAGAVATDTLGAGAKFQRLVRKVELALNPPPDRATVATITITPRPSLATSSPAPQSQAPGQPSATPTQPPIRKAVNFRIAVDPNAIFKHEIRTVWCAPAGIQIVLAANGRGDTTDAFQRKLAGQVGKWESYADSHDGGWGPAAMVEALAAYGVPGYEIHASETRQGALRDAATAMSKTGAPVILMSWYGAHTWVMNGYRATADPAIFDDATVTGAYILDPWYPDASTIWGQSDPPGAFQDTSEMIRNFLPWKRPEGHYRDRDGKYIIVVPTLPLIRG